MKKTLKFLSFLTALFLFLTAFTACDSSGKTPASPYGEDEDFDGERPLILVEDVCTLKEIPIPDGYSIRLEEIPTEYNDVPTVREIPPKLFYDRLCVFLQNDKKENCLAFYDRTGEMRSLEKDTDYTAPAGADFVPQSFSFRADGSYAVYGYTGEKQAWYLLTFDADGGLLSRSDSIPGGCEAYNLHYFEDGWVYLYFLYASDGAHGFLFDPTLQTSEKRWAFFPQYSLVNLDEHTVAMRNDTGYFLYDREADLLDNFTGWNFCENTDAAQDIIMNAEFCYYALPDGIIRQAKDGTEEKILDYTNSGLSAETLTYLGALPGDTLVVNYRNELLNKTVLSMLIPCGDVEIPQKTELTAASLGLENETRLLLLASVREFNRTSDRYHITLTDYDRIVYEKAEDDSFVLNDQRNLSFNGFEEDVVQNGVRYDFYLFGRHEEKMSFNYTENLGSYQNYRVLMERLGLFSPLPDLSSFGLLPSTNGVLGESTVPLTMRLSTYVAPAALIPQGDHLTLDRLYAIADSCEAGETLSGGFHDFKTAESVALHDFYDEKTAEAHFDTPEYEKLLSFIKQTDTAEFRYGPRIDGMKLNGKYSTLFYYGAESDHLFSHEIRLLKFDMVCPDAIYNLCCELYDTPYTLCGYPAEDALMFYFESDLSLCFGNECNRRGVEAYLSFMLSDEVQTSDGIAQNALPVTSSALEQLLAPGYYYYSYPENVNIYGTEMPRRNVTMRGRYDEPVLSLDENSDGSAEPNKMLYLDEKTMNGWFDTISNVRLCTAQDSTVKSIITEELSYYEAGARSCEEAAKLIQNRVSIYLSEQQ